MFRFDPVPLRMLGPCRYIRRRAPPSMAEHLGCREALHLPLFCLAQEKETQPRMTGAVFSTRRLRENQRK